MATNPAGTRDLALRLATDLDGAFVELVLTRQDRLWSGVRRLVSDSARAEDVVQEVFARAHRALASWPRSRIEALKVDGWLWTIALNEIRNGARNASRRPREVPLDERPRPATSATGPEEHALTTLDRERLDTALATLPIAQRDAVVLRHVVGLGPTEIAAVVDRPVGTVKSDVHRGLTGLRRVLGEDDPADPEPRRIQR